MVISRGHDNAFASLNLANAVTRLLVAECKSVEVTAERVEKRYAQVCRGLIPQN